MTSEGKRRGSHRKRGARGISMGGSPRPENGSFSAGLIAKQETDRKQTQIPGEGMLFPMEIDGGGEPGHRQPIR